MDEVIRIVREEDEPKQVMMAAFKISDIQAEAILNMRLRALRKLEEIEIRTEHQQLSEELKGLQALMGSEDQQWGKVAGEIKETRTAFGKKTEIGKRRADFETVPEMQDLDLDAAMIEKEPVTVVLSQKGWVRALKGHQGDLSKITFKAGDEVKKTVLAHTTDKLVLFATNGKFFTIGVDKLPGGRGHGEPVRIMIELEACYDIVTMFIHQPGEKMLLASTAGYGLCGGRG